MTLEPFADDELIGLLGALIDEFGPYVLKPGEFTRHTLEAQRPNLTSRQAQTVIEKGLADGKIELVGRYSLDGTSTAVYRFTLSEAGEQ